MHTILFLLAMLFIAPGTANAIAEDDAGWNCATMGNHICGPGIEPPSVPASAIVVPLPDGSRYYLTESE
jgi:hypothetical protein